MQHAVDRRGSPRWTGRRRTIEMPATVALLVLERDVAVEPFIIAHSMPPLAVLSVAVPLPALMDFCERGLFVHPVPATT